MDLVIRHASLRDREGTVDIGVNGGVIEAVEPHLDDAGDTEIDAGGMLVSESFANPHLHLCKVWTLDRMDEAALADYHGGSMGKAMTAIELAARVKADYDRS